MAMAEQQRYMWRVRIENIPAGLHDKEQRLLTELSERLNEANFDTHIQIEWDDCEERAIAYVSSETAVAELVSRKILIEGNELKLTAETKGQFDSMTEKNDVGMLNLASGDEEANGDISSMLALGDREDEPERKASQEKAQDQYDKLLLMIRYGPNDAEGSWMNKRTKNTGEPSRCLYFWQLFESDPHQVGGVVEPNFLSSIEDPTETQTISPFQYKWRTLPALQSLEISEAYYKFLHNVTGNLDVSINFADKSEYKVNFSSMKVIDVHGQPHSLRAVEWLYGEVLEVSEADQKWGFVCFDEHAAIDEHGNSGWFDHNIFSFLFSDCTPATARYLELLLEKEVLASEDGARKKIGARIPVRFRVRNSRQNSDPLAVDVEIVTEATIPVADSSPPANEIAVWKLFPACDALNSVRPGLFPHSRFRNQRFMGRVIGRARTPDPFAIIVYYPMSNHENTSPSRHRNNAYKIRAFKCDTETRLWDKLVPGLTVSFNIGHSRMTENDSACECAYNLDIPHRALTPPYMHQRPSPHQYCGTVGIVPTPTKPGWMCETRTHQVYRLSYNEKLVYLRDSPCFFNVDDNNCAVDVYPVEEVPPEERTKYLTPNGRTKLDATKFVIGTALATDETRHIEFKAFQMNSRDSDVRNIIFNSEKYLNAMLNTQGGSVFFGVQDDATVVGQGCLDSSTRDFIRIQVGDRLASFQPPVEPDYYNIKFIECLDRQGLVLPYTYVIECSAIDQRSKGVRIEFATSQGLKYQRRMASTGTMNDIEDVAIINALEARARSLSTEPFSEPLYSVDDFHGFFPNSRSSIAEVIDYEEDDDPDPDIESMSLQEVIVPGEAEKMSIESPPSKSPVAMDVEGSENNESNLPSESERSAVWEVQNDDSKWVTCDLVLAGMMEEMYRSGDVVKLVTHPQTEHKFVINLSSCVLVDDESQAHRSIRRKTAGLDGSSEDDQEPQSPLDVLSRDLSSDSVLPQAQFSSTLNAAAPDYVNSSALDTEVGSTSQVDFALPTRPVRDYLKNASVHVVQHSHSKNGQDGQSYANPQEEIPSRKRISNETLSATAQQYGLSLDVIDSAFYPALETPPLPPPPRLPPSNSFSDPRGMPPSIRQGDSSETDIESIMRQARWFVQSREHPQWREYTQELSLEIEKAYQRCCSELTYRLEYCGTIFAISFATFRQKNLTTNEEYFLQREVPQSWDDVTALNLPRLQDRSKYKMIAFEFSQKMGWPKPSVRSERLSTERPSFAQWEGRVAFGPPNQERWAVSRGPTLKFAAYDAFRKLICKVIPYNELEPRIQAKYQFNETNESTPDGAPRPMTSADEEGGSVTASAISRFTKPREPPNVMMNPAPRAPLSLPLPVPMQPIPNQMPTYYPDHMQQVYGHPSVHHPAVREPQYSLTQVGRNYENEFPRRAHHRYHPSQHMQRDMYSYPRRPRGFNMMGDEYGRPYGRPPPGYPGMNPYRGAAPPRIPAGMTTGAVQPMSANDFGSSGPQTMSMSSDVGTAPYASGPRALNNAPPSGIGGYRHGGNTAMKKDGEASTGRDDVPSYPSTYHRTQHSPLVAKHPKSEVLEYAAKRHIPTPQPTFLFVEAEKRIWTCEINFLNIRIVEKDIKKKVAERKAFEQLLKALADKKMSEE